MVESPLASMVSLENAFTPDKRTLTSQVEEVVLHSRNSTFLRQKAVIGRREDRITYQKASQDIIGLTQWASSLEQHKHY
jgi:hypothetical protein